MPTTQHTPAGEALRAMLPAGTDPYTTIELACHTAFLARDRDILRGITDVVKTDPQLAASLIVTLASLVDVDARPAGMLAWLGTSKGQQQETARQVAALAEARAEYDAAAADTLPPVTLESMREMAHAARLARVAQPCGTVGGWSRHIRKKQSPCQRCSQARTLYDNATPEQVELLKTPVAGSGPHPVAYAPACGTVAGYDMHIEFGEQPCPRCLWIAAESVRKHDALARSRSRLKPPVVRANCGSHSGYNSHKDHREEACDRCQVAQKIYDDERYRRKCERQGREPRKRTAGQRIKSHDFPIATEVAARADIQEEPIAA